MSVSELRTRENNDENKMTRKINLILHSEAYVNIYLSYDIKESAHPSLNHPFLRMKGLNFRPNYTCFDFQLGLGVGRVTKFLSFFRFDSVEYTEIKTNK